MPRVIFPNERATLLVEAHGPIELSTGYATGGGPGDSPYVVVRSPDTLVYALDPRAVAAVTYSLLLAKFRGGRALPQEFRPREQTFDRSVVGSVTLRGDRRIGEPKILSADKSPTGVAHVLLRIDAVTLRVFDQAALDAYTRAWAEGYQAVEEAFGQAPTLSIGALMHRAAQQARSPYLLDSLSEISRQMPGAAPGHIERSSEVRPLT